jgi:hypothetical protein
VRISSRLTPSTFLPNCSNNSADFIILTRGDVDDVELDVAFQLHKNLSKDSKNEIRRLRWIA